MALTQPPLEPADCFVERARRGAGGGGGEQHAWARRGVWPAPHRVLQLGQAPLQRVESGQLFRLCPGGESKNIGLLHFKVGGDNKYNDNEDDDDDGKEEEEEEVRRRRMSTKKNTEEERQEERWRREKRRKNKNRDQEWRKRLQKNKKKTEDEEE